MSIRGVFSFCLPNETQQTQNPTSLEQELAIKFLLNLSSSIYNNKTNLSDHSITKLCAYFHNNLARLLENIDGSSTRKNISKLKTSLIFFAFLHARNNNIPLTNNTKVIDIVIKHMALKQFSDFFKTHKGDSKKLYSEFLDSFFKIEYVIQNIFKTCDILSQAKVFNKLLDEPSLDTTEAIIWSSYYGHLKIVKRLLADQKVDPAINQNEAIRMASKQGHTEIVQTLLNDPRVDPSANNNEALLKASENGHIDIVRLLLAHPKVNPETYFMQSKNPNSEEISQILQTLLNRKDASPFKKLEFSLKSSKAQAAIQVVTGLLGCYRFYQIEPVKFQESPVLDLSLLAFSCDQVYNGFCSLLNANSSKSISTHFWEKIIGIPSVSIPKHEISVIFTTLLFSATRSS